jgi:hypothetical protein
MTAQADDSVPFYATAAIVCGEFPAQDGRDLDRGGREFFRSGTEFREPRRVLHTPAESYSNFTGLLR